MKTVLKNIVARTYKPLLVKYLSKTRVYRHEGIRLEVPPQVFHPGFFSSTQLLLKYIRGLKLAGRKFLELGAGSGFISIYAARQEAIVTATDINPTAIEWLEKNSANNKVRLDIIHSDLFTGINERSFDIIAINPPYYKKQPRTDAEHAWFCGENGEYFTQLFGQLPAHIHQHTEILMVLCDGCDIEMVRTAAAANGFELCLELTQPTLLEKNFIYKIVQIKPA